jgi:hypothetical protein
MIIDAGGGTVDISTYTFTSATPIKVKEIAIPACKCLHSLDVPFNLAIVPGVFEGSVIVRQRAENHIRGKNSKFLIIILVLRF